MIAAAGFFLVLVFGRLRFSDAMSISSMELEIPMQDWHNTGKTNTFAASYSDKELHRAGMDRSMALGTQQGQNGSGTGHTSLAQSRSWRRMDQNPDQLRLSCWRLAEGVVERPSGAQHF